MAYPYDELTTGERLVLHQHPHWKTLLPPLALNTLLVAGAVWAGVALGHATAWYILAALAGIATVYFGLVPYVRWKTTHFVLTTEKVMIREGVLRRTGMHIPLRRIVSVQTEIDLNDRIFGCGSLIVESASAEPLRFTDIAEISHVHGLLYHVVDGNLDQLIPA